MTLVLEIEHLLGIAFAAQSQASTTPDWPPQPNRVFSALVAAWGARGEKPDERRALEWLESQPTPELAASGGFARTPATAFVPPNDPKTGRAGNRSVMPAFRRRQPRRFPAFRPDDPVVRFVWRDVNADGEIVIALNALAADTPYVGHSSSLTRCRFRTDGVPERTALPRRRVYRGRLAELERTYRAGDRPSPGADVLAGRAGKALLVKSIFADHWLVLEHVDGDMPDLRAAPLVAKALRGALMSGYKKNGRDAAIPAAVTGHSVDGSPAAESHLAIAPLAFLGSRFADGRTFGFALIPPNEGELLANEDFRNAVRAIAVWKAERGRRELRLACDGFDLTFTPSGEGTRRSLEPAPYVAVAKTWATCTPVVLDRHLKAKGNAERDAEVASLLRHACTNIGLPEPREFPSASTRPCRARHRPIPPAVPHAGPVGAYPTASPADS
jgi:CRISPR-associated protein Csb2